MTDHPNLLFLFPDQWRWDWLGCHGTVPVATPHLDALAARGLRFTHCRVNSPLCSPSRACLATLRRYEDCGVRDNRGNTDPADAILFRALRDAGYRVATCGKDDLHKGDKVWSRDGWMPALGRLGFTEAIAHAGKWDSTNKARRGDAEHLTALYAHEGILAEYIAFMETQRPIDHLPGAHSWTLPEHLHTDAVCGRNALRLLDGFPPGHPWALWVNFPGPHEPQDPPLRWAETTAATVFPDPVGMTANASGHQRQRQQYAANCAHIDAWVGRLIDRIDQRGERDRTLIVFASDHGEMLGDHGRYHKHVAYDGSVRVPCILAGPGVTRTGTSSALVELIDIGATLLDAAGIGAEHHRAAHSLLPIARGTCQDGDHRAFQRSALNTSEGGVSPWQSITTTSHKLISSAEGHRLFALDEDPGETCDRAAELPAVVDELIALAASSG